MKIISPKNIKIDESFAEEVAKRSGQNVFACYQCKKCASGCPMRAYMDHTPTDLIRFVQLGMADEATCANTIWYCLACQTCTARCPQDIDIALVADTIKILADEKKIKAGLRSVRLFHMLCMLIVKFTGRMYEIGLVGMLNLLTGNPFKDLPLGMKMIKKGKLKIIPTIQKPFSMLKMFARARRLRK